MTKLCLGSKNDKQPPVLNAEHKPNLKPCISNVTIGYEREILQLLIDSGLFSVSFENFSKTSRLPMKGCHI